MAATLLTQEPVTLRNVPSIIDTAVMREILLTLGGTVEDTGGERMVLKSDGLRGEVSPELGRRMRASIVLLGPLVARAGLARLPRPGGDSIGARRVEQHLRGLRAMGAEIKETPSEFIARAPSRLRGARIVLDLPTVTGTENLIMAATLAEGRTEIINAAREPHVHDLCRCLTKMGADIRGAGTDEIVVLLEKVEYVLRCPSSDPSGDAAWVRYGERAGRSIRRSIDGRHAKPVSAHDASTGRGNGIDQR